MSSITVRQTTQKIVVDAATGAVSVISTGPQGPAGPPGDFPITFGDSPPIGPNIEDLWVNTTNFTLYGFYNDGDSTQWVEIGKLDVADLDLEALADALVPYILSDPDFEAGTGTADTTPATVTISGTSHTMTSANVTRLNLFDNEALITVTLPAGVFANGDWFSLQSLGAAGITFDTTGLTVVGVPTIPDLNQYEGVTVIYTSPTSISFFGSGSGGGGAPGDHTDATPPAGTISTTTHTLDSSDLARLTMFDNAAEVAVTVPTGTFENGDWFTLQSLGAGGMTFDYTGLTINGGSAITAIAQGESISVIFTGANTISVVGTSGELVTAIEPYNEVAATGSTENLDMDLSFQKLIMDQNCLFDVTNLAAAGEVKTSYVYITGAFTPSFSANFDWGDAGAPTYSDGTLIVLTSMNGETTVAAAMSGGGFAV